MEKHKVLIKILGPQANIPSFPGVKVTCTCVRGNHQLRGGQSVQSRPWSILLLQHTQWWSRDSIYALVKKPIEKKTGLLWEDRVNSQAVQIRLSHFFLIFFWKLIVCHWLWPWKGLTIVMSRQFCSASNINTSANCKFNCYYRHF